jgi:hypothetical protein
LPTLVLNTISMRTTHKSTWLLILQRNLLPLPLCKPVLT